MNPDYTVQSADGRFQLHAPSGRVILTFGDEATARQYARLLSEAYKAGFKNGFKAGKSNS